MDQANRDTGVGELATVPSQGPIVVQDPGFPPVPADLQPLTKNEDRERAFGKFAYRLAPADGPGAIAITDSWEAKNIVKVQLPFFRDKPVRFNVRAAQQLIDLWHAWKDAGLSDRVLTWDGGFVPRFVRGSTTLLSNHSWGTAFDINAEWNGLGQGPAYVGDKGSVRELVKLANEHGFWWGGHYKSRLDGMHFEVAKLLR